MEFKSLKTLNGFDLLLTGLSSSFSLISPRDSLRCRHPPPLARILCPPILYSLTLFLYRRRHRALGSERPKPRRNRLGERSTPHRCPGS